MNTITLKLFDIVKGFLRETHDTLVFFYEYNILRTPLNLSWVFKVEENEVVGLKLKDDAGRVLARLEGNDLSISGDCKASFYVDSYVSIRAIRKFILKWLKRERNVSLKFDSRFSLLSYDCCEEEQAFAINCRGIWHERDNRRWLEDLNGRLIAQYDVNTCKFKYLKGDWKTIDSINIIWNSEEDFRNFIERHVSLGAKEII